jgi:hypothetical protein
MAITFFQGITLVVDMDIGFCYRGILAGLARIGVREDLPQMIQRWDGSGLNPFFYDDKHEYRIPLHEMGLLKKEGLIL